MKTLERNELKELLIKCWMTHDAMWFSSCLREFGIEKANRINKAVHKAVTPIMIKRIQKAVGVEKLDTFDEFKRFLEIASEIGKGEFMKYTYSMAEKNMLHVEWESCFAYEGMKALGVMDRYECGVMLRNEIWFDTLGIKYEVEPKVTGCMMHTDGRCFRDYKFFFDK